MVIVACGGAGFSMAMYYKHQLASIKQLIKTLEYIYCELEFRLTPLPELCQKAAACACGGIKDTFQALSEELCSQMAPDVKTCMTAALSRVRLPEKTEEIMLELGTTLGQFDLSGQLQGLDAVLADSRSIAAQLETERPQRVRSYQTLGLCAGAVLAILLV